MAVNSLSSAKLSDPSRQTSVRTGNVVGPFYNAATGGTTSDVANYNGTGQTWRVHTFTGDGSFVITGSNQLFSVMVCGSGSGSYDRGNGTWIAGCPPVIVSDSRILANGTYAVTVGTASGDNTAGKASTLGSISAAGGTMTGSGLSLAWGSNGPVTNNTISGTAVRYGERPNYGGPSSGAGQASLAGAVIVAYQIA